jgi:uncharacterized protein YjcR
MHGGTSPGAPRGNQNALKHGRYTWAASLERLQLKQTVHELQRLIGLAGEGKPKANKDGS